MIKKVVVCLLALIMLLLFTTVTSEEVISNNIKLNAADPPVEQDPPIDEDPPTNQDPPLAPDLDPPQSDPTIPTEECTVNLSNLSQFNLVVLGDATLSGHVRGSIWVGGTLYGNPWHFVDDGSVNHEGAGTSYVATNESQIQFKGRTSEQGLDAYSILDNDSVTSTASYWRNLISNIDNTDENWIYLQPDSNGHVDLLYWDYQCPGSDESQSSINKIYWTDATSVTMGGLAGHLIAPYADVNIVNCNHCGSIVAKTLISSGESHINYWAPSKPDKVTPSPTPSPTPTATPTPTPTPTSSSTTTDTSEIMPSPTPTARIPDSPTLQLGILKITKIVAINGKETQDKIAQGYTFNFRVIGPYGFDKVYKLTVKKGNNSITIKDLEPGSYRVIEINIDKHFRVHSSQFAEVEVNYNSTANVTFVNDYYNTPTPTPTKTVTPTDSSLPTPYINEKGEEFYYEPTRKRWYHIADYAVPLGVDVMINHVGDCFD